jgi:4'-phosphopantetheinyl transferase
VRREAFTALPGLPKFQSPASPPPLVHGEAQVWYLSIADAAPAVEDAALLDRDERGRAERIANAGVRRRFVATRAALRRALGGYLGCDPTAVPIDSPARTKPRLAPDARAPDIAFSVSHSGGAALMAFGRDGELGVDLEYLDRRVDAAGLAESHFHPREADAIVALHGRDRMRRFLIYWTRKEAVVKALGIGLRRPLDSFTVDAGCSEPFALHDLRPAPGFVGALAAPLGTTRVRPLRMA